MNTAQASRARPTAPGIIPAALQVSTAEPKPTRNSTKPINISRPKNRFLRIIEALSSLSPDEEYYKLNLQGLTTSLFCECIKRLNLIGGRADDSHAVRVVVDFCSKNFKRELSLALLENELHLSKYYISHIFSDKLGVSFNDYVNSLRISYACRKLISTDMSVTKIGEIAGFSTLRTFNRAFFKQMNTSPSEYRKNYLQSNNIASLPV